MGRRRLRALTRLLGGAILVGIVAGVGGIGFFSACQLVVHYTLDAWPGIKPMPPPAAHRQHRAFHGVVAGAVAGPLHWRAGWQTGSLARPIAIGIRRAARRISGRD